MSELAERERRVKRRWAVPGGSHDRVVRALKLALPALIGVILAFLMMIGAVLIADGFGVHVPKGYIYAAMAFSGAVETLNITARRRRERKAAAAGNAAE